MRARLEKFDRKDKMAGTSLYLPSEVRLLLRLPVGASALPCGCLYHLSPAQVASLLNTYTGEESDVLIFPSPRLSDLTWRILSMPSVGRDGQSGRLGEAIAGLHGLIRLHLKAWGCPLHSLGETRRLIPHPRGRGPPARGRTT